MENKNQIIEYKKEIANLVSNQQVFTNLLQITFNGLSKENALQAMLEGRMTGFSLQNFLQKDVYAIPFKAGYSLVTSIDYARKIGQKEGVVGVSAPKYVEKDEKIVSCEITVKKLVQGVIGEFSALVYFDEYYKSNKYGNSLWDTKPRTMIAKVAEMHALRKACPEELQKAYIEEEYVRERQVVEEEKEEKEEIKEGWKEKMKKCKTIEELGKVWSDMPGSMKNEKVVQEYKEELKTKLAPKTEEEQVIEAEIE
jgi:hypothetical protein